MNGYRSVPDLNYAVSSFAYTLYLPLYMYAVDQNILFVRPDYFFVFFTLSIVFFQIAAIKIQQTQPRFLIPRSIRHEWRA